MATQIFATDSIGTDVRITLVDGENVFVGRNATIGSTDFIAIAGLGESHEAMIQGSVIADSIGIRLGAALAISNNSVTIAKGGYVQSFANAAVVVSGILGQVINDGVIIGRNAGVQIGGFSDDADPLFGQSTVVNSGRIEGVFGISRLVGANRMIELHNSGVISAEIAYEGEGTNGIDRIFNTGRMEGFVLLGPGSDLYDGGSGRITGYVDGGPGKDTIVCGRGDDRLSGGAGADSMRGGAGNDTYLVDNPGDRIVESNAASGGNDTVLSGISINLGNSTIVKGGVEAVTLVTTGNLSVTGNALDNVISGFTDNNVLRGGGGKDLIFAHEGNDRLLGQAGNDILRGGSGNDTVDGGTGNDVLIGEGGADRFVFAPGGGTDRIRDFEDGADRIHLAAFGFASVQEARAHATEQQGNVVFDFDGDGTLIVENVTKAQLTAADLII